MILHPLFFGTGAIDYQITNSLRFRGSNSAYLTRSAGTPTNNIKWTWSAWIKIGNITQQLNFLASTAAPSMYLGIETFSTNSFVMQIAGNRRFITRASFRDPMAWYHFVFVFDSANQTSDDKAILYVNGIRATTLTNAIQDNQTTSWNAVGTNTQLIGYSNGWSGTSADYFDGCMTEVHFVDGQALTASSFGQTDPITGAWIPKKYIGTYGNNGFYLEFKDASAATNTAIGKDSSVNGNHWTPSGISVTSGVTFDQMTDTPTNNYALYDALTPIGSASSIGSLTNANMTFNHSAANYAQRFGSFTVNSGKWYFEYTITTFSSNKSCVFGIGKTADYPSGGGTAGSWTGCVGYGDFGDSYLRPITESGGLTNISGVAGTTFAVNDVIMIAFVVGAGKFWMGKNGTWFDSGNPGAGTGEKQTFTANINWRPWCVQYGSSAAAAAINCGQRPFIYTPPSGFLALNTSNFSVPTLRRGDDAFQAVTRTGTGAIANVSSLRFSPDLVWIKSRSNATNHNLFDSVRGANSGLVTNSTAVQYTDANSLTSFSSTGYNLGTDSGSRGVNANTHTYVDWSWRKGALFGFDIVTYTGTSANTNVSHSLGVVPSMIVVKQRTANATTNWATWHTSIANTNYLLLNSTAASAAGATYWNNITANSTTFSLGTAGDVNFLNATYVAYLWSEVAGFSRFGSYVGNNSTDGPFVWCGFRPRFLLLRTNELANWFLVDAARSTTNPISLSSRADNSTIETSFAYLDILSNGFKIRSTAGGGINSASTTTFFAAFAETPFKYARAR